MSRNAPLTSADYEERRREVEPLFAYMAAHYLSPSRVLWEVVERYGRPRYTRQWLFGLRGGHSPAPWWLVRDFCKVLELPMAEVMGPGWVAEFGEKYGLVPVEPLLCSTASPSSASSESSSAPAA